MALVCTSEPFLMSYSSRVKGLFLQLHIVAPGASTFCRPMMGCSQSAGGSLSSHLLLLPLWRMSASPGEKVAVEGWDKAEWTQQWEKDEEAVVVEWEVADRRKRQLMRREGAPWWPSTLRRPEASADPSGYNASRYNIPFNQIVWWVKNGSLVHLVSQVGVRSRNCKQPERGIKLG